MFALQKHKLYLVFTLLLSTQFLIGQIDNKQDYFWHFGEDRSDAPGIQSFQFDFNNEPFQIDSGTPILEFDSNNASICDPDGNLLFYTNGCAIANRFNEIMPEGDSINAGFYFDIAWGGDCSNGYPGIQDIIILEDPGNNFGYYVIHKPRLFEFGAPSYTQNIYYSYVDMRLDNGKGDIVVKNQIFYNEFQTLSSYLTAIMHTNGKDWWVIQPALDSNLYLTFLIDEFGIHRMPDQSIGDEFTDDFASTSGTAKFSSDGNKYAYFNIYDQLFLMDFDRSTGLLSNFENVFVHDTTMNAVVFSSLEWSPDSRFIYTATWTKLHQVDTHTENIQGSIELIDTYNNTQYPGAPPFRLLTQGPDCRIFLCGFNGTDYFHVIEKPNEKGQACNFKQNGISLPFRSGKTSMPNHPRWRVDDELKCDPSISSSLFNHSNEFNLSGLKLSPNPVYDVLNLSIPHGREMTYLEIFTFDGTRVLSKGGSYAQIELNQLPSGMYLIKVGLEDGKIMLERFVKR